jgi:hypothetical protein
MTPWQSKAAGPEQKKKASGAGGQWGQSHGGDENKTRD